MTAFTMRVLGGRRPDGTLREGPTGLRSPLAGLIGTPSVAVRETQARAAAQAEAVREGLRRSGVHRRAQAPPVVLALPAVPHPRQCKKVLRNVGERR